MKRISLYKDEFETEATFEPAERRFMGRPVSRIYLTEDPLGDAITFVFPAGTNVLPALLRRAYGGACKDKTCILEPSTQGGLEYATYEQSSFRDQPTEMPTIRCVYNIGP